MNWISYFLSKIDPNYLSFTSGILLSTAINVYTGIFLAENLPKSLITISVSFILMMISAALLTNLAIRLQILRDAAIEKAPKNFTPAEKERIYVELISRNSFSLAAKFSMALILAIAGFVLLAIPATSQILEILRSKPEAK